MNQFAVDWDGNILPCHIFTGYSEKILGNIYNSDVLKDTKNLFASKDNENCKECTDKRFCQKCLLDIENNHYRCDNFREGLNVFYDNMLYLFTFEQDRYRKFTQDIMKFYKKHLEEEFENDHYTRVVQ